MISANDLSIGVIFPGICLAVSIPLYFLRNRHWQMSNHVATESATGAESSRNAFTTRQLMYFIAGASLPLTLFGCLIRRVTMIDSTGWVGSIARGLGVGGVMGLISAPLLIALLGTMLATTHRIRFIIALLAILALLTVAAVGLTITIGEQLSASMQLIQVLVGYCVAAAVSFWVMKCCGYSLCPSWVYYSNTAAHTHRSSNGEDVESPC